MHVKLEFDQNKKYSLKDKSFFFVVDQRFIFWLPETVQFKQTQKKTSRNKLMQQNIQQNTSNHKMN